MRNIQDQAAGLNPYVDERAGNAFKVIQHVAQYTKEIHYVSTNMEHVYAVSTEMEKVIAVIDNLADIQTTVANLDAILGVVNQVAIANESAATATTQAGIATAQATIATTKAGEAAASAIAAQAYASGGSGGGASIVWSTITGPASVAASVSGSYLCDASSGAITVTLPDTASEGDEVVVATMAEAPLYPVTLSGGGAALMDQPEDLVLNLPQTEFRCIRLADPYGWHIIASGVGLSTNGNATNALSESRIVNVPNDYATLDAALEYASSLIPLNGATLTIEIEDTETIGQISLQGVDLSFLHIKGLGAGPWIDRDDLTEFDPPAWIFACNAKLNSVYGTFRVTGESENVRAVDLYNCDMCLGRYDEWEPLVIDGVMKWGSNINYSRVMLIRAALDSGEDNTCISVWDSDVVSYNGVYRGNIYLHGGRFSSNGDSFASISESGPGPTIRVTDVAEMTLNESTVKGLISVTDQSIMRGEVSIIEHEDTQMSGYPLIVADLNSVVSLDVSDFEPLEESSVPLAKASDLSHITLTTLGFGPGTTSLGLAAEVETGGQIFLGSITAAAFSGGFSQTPNQLTPDGFIFVEGMEVPSVGIESIVAGTNVTVDNTDPKNPVVSSLPGRDIISFFFAAGSLTLDAHTEYFNIQLGGDITDFLFVNLPGASRATTLLIKFVQDSTPRTVTWPASFKWAGGTAGAVSTAAGAVDILALTTFDNGTTWQASLANGFA